MTGASRDAGRATAQPAALTAQGPLGGCVPVGPCLSSLQQVLPLGVGTPAPASPLETGQGGRALTGPGGKMRHRHWGDEQGTGGHSSSLSPNSHKDLHVSKTPSLSGSLRKTSKMSFGTWRSRSW